MNNNIVGKVLSLENDNNLTSSGVSNVILYNLVDELKETNRLLMIIARSFEDRDNYRENKHSLGPM